MGLLRTLGSLFGGYSWRVSDQLEAQGSGPLDYPATISLDDMALTLRPLTREDRGAIERFAKSLPPHDLLFLRRDITQPDQIDNWLQDIEEGDYITVVAMSDDGEIMGYATVASEGLSWTRHVAELRVLVSPLMRGKRLGRLLTEQAFGLAKQRGVKKLMAQMTTDQKAAIKVFGRMGFHPEAKLRNQVMDRDGRLHDLQIMSLDVEAFQTKIDIMMLGSGTEFPGT